MIHGIPHKRYHNTFGLERMSSMYYQQNGGFVRVRDETEAINYPVAPGYSVTFIDETASHFYVKTAGLSQFDRPTFDKFKLVRETPTRCALTRLMRRTRRSLTCRDSLQWLISRHLRALRLRLSLLTTKHRLPILSSIWLPFLARLSLFRIPTVAHKTSVVAVA